MSNVKISALPSATSLVDGNVVPIVNGGSTKKARVGSVGSDYIPFVDSTGAMVVGSSLPGRGGRLAIVGAAIATPPAVGSGTGAALVQTYSPTSTDWGLISGVVSTSGNGFIQVQDLVGGVSVYGLMLQPNGGPILAGTPTDRSSGKLQVAGNVSPDVHNTSDLGTTSLRWKDLWLQSGAFNGSDARLKTEIQPFTAKEIEASKQLSKEIGTYQWLESVKEKGANKARRHVGMTVQRAIEIMTTNGLNPFDYGFIGYDKWDDTIVHHDEIKAAKAQPAELDEAGNVVKEATPEVKYQKAWDEVVLKAGDAFSFRYDQLNQFIARGFEARLTALEALL